MRIENHNSLFDREILNIVDAAATSVLPTEDLAKHIEEDLLPNVEDYLNKAIEFLDNEQLKAAIDSGQITVAMIRPRLDAIEKISGPDHEIAKMIKNRLTGELDIVFEMSFPNLSEDAVAKFYSNVKPKMIEMGVWNRFADMMTSGPLTFLILHDEGGHAVDKWRGLIGKTNPEEADAGTIRADFAKSLQNNVVHGSDSVDSVHNEVAWIREQIRRFNP